jgi:ribosomal RNA-processing protein 1
MALAERLAEVLSQVPEDVGKAYFQAFLRTMRREWFGIDHLRLNKFMVLVRKFVTQLLRHLQAASW